MDQITLAELGKVLLVAFAVAVVTQFIKVSSLIEWRANKYFGLIVNGIGFVLAFVLTFIAQRISWILPGWEYTVFAGIMVMGLAVLQYEAMKNLWKAITGQDLPEKFGIGKQG